MGTAIPKNLIDLDCDAVRRPNTSAQELDEALAMLAYSPDPADQLIAREVPRADMAMTQPDDTATPCDKRGRFS